MKHSSRDGSTMELIASHQITRVLRQAKEQRNLKARRREKCRAGWKLLFEGRR